MNMCDVSTKKPSQRTQRTAPEENKTKIASHSLTLIPTSGLQYVEWKPKMTVNVASWKTEAEYKISIHKKKQNMI